MIPKHLKEQIEAELTFAPPIKCEGWTDSVRGIEMAELVLEHKPHTIVEIGCFGARSTLCLGLAIKELGPIHFGHVYTIDPWRKEAALEGESDANRGWWNAVDLHDIHKKAMEVIWRLGLDPYVTVIRNYSHTAFRLFENHKPQFVLIDGNHSERCALQDAQLYGGVLESGGFLWFDDSDWESTKKAVEYLNNNMKLIKDGGKYRIYQKV